MVWAKAASSAASAVMLDGNSAEAHTSLAHVKATQDWDWQGAEREFQVAIGARPLLRDRAPLVRDVVPRADGPARRSARGDAARAVARSGVVDRRARPRRRCTPTAATTKRRWSSAITPIELNPHFSSCLLGARAHPGTAEGSRRSDRRVPARDRSVAAEPAHARRARPHAGVVGQTGAGACRAAQARSDRQAALRLAVRVRLGPLRARPDGPRLPVAEEGRRGPRLRRDRAQGRSAVRGAEDRQPAGRQSSSRSV